MTPEYEVVVMEIARVAIIYYRESIGELCDLSDPYLNAILETLNHEMSKETEVIGF